MKKFLIAAAVAASALTATAPAAAQWQSQPQGYGYNNFGQGRHLVERVQRIRFQIRELQRHGRISNRQADRLSDEVRDLQRQIQYSARGGVDGRERQGAEFRLQRLEQRVRMAANDGRWDRGGYRDHDRDGRNDRFEDDGGHYHDGRWDR